jgi:signal transduction histidine kinase
VADVRLRTQADCAVDARPLRVVADPILVRRAVVNLLDNAVRAAGPGGLVQARVRCDGDLVVVEIEDDGPGWGHVPPGTASLGLGVANNCVGAHGGDLELETGQLGGALVRMRFPRQRSASDPEPLPGPASDVGESGEHWEVQGQAG